jgi:hypothetical protein
LAGGAASASDLLHRASIPLPCSSARILGGQVRRSPVVPLPGAASPKCRTEGYYSSSNGCCIDTCKMQTDSLARAYSGIRSFLSFLHRVPANPPLPLRPLSYSPPPPLLSLVSGGGVSRLGQIRLAGCLLTLPSRWVQRGRRRIGRGGCESDEADAGVDHHKRSGGDGEQVLQHKRAVSVAVTEDRASASSTVVSSAAASGPRSTCAPSSAA